VKRLLVSAFVLLAGGCGARNSTGKIPVRIAVGGGIVRSWDRLRPQLAQALTAGVPFPPELVVARFPYEAPLLGAVALAVEAARGRQRQQPDTTHQDTMIMDTMA